MAILGTNVIVGGGGGDGHTKYTDTEAIAAVEGEATLALAGDVDIATGKTLSADGLLFPDTQVASADANELDDYEKGTFTPTISDVSLEGTGESQTYSVQVGRYTKIGNRVYFSINVTITSLGTLSTVSGVNVTGLPFTSEGTTNNFSAVSFGFCGSLALPNSGESFAGDVAPGVAHVVLRLWDGTVGTSLLLISELSAGAQVILSGNYEV